VRKTASRLELTASEACHRLALSEGQKENIHLKKEEINKMKKKNFLAITLTAILMLSFMSIISIQPASAENVTGYDSIEEIDGKDWYYWFTYNSRHSAIVLYDGDCDYTHVTIDSLEDQYTEARMDLIEDLDAEGYNILTPAESCLYSSSNHAWLTKAADWLKTNGKGLVTLFGWGVGGAAVGYEIQKEHAEDYYTCAVIADAPVGLPYQSLDYIYYAASNAANAKVAAAFICSDNDYEYGYPGYGPCAYMGMDTYYDNMPAGLEKEWHDWNEGADAHDPFPDTCEYHNDETVFDVAYNFEITVEDWSGPANIGGVNWYRWGDQSDSVAILLFGGAPYASCVYDKVFSSAAELNFIHEVQASGIDVISLYNNRFYYSYYDWVADTADELRDPQGAYCYDNICIFGHSAGGLIVSHEILKTGADSRYDAAIIACAPVNGLYIDGYCNYTDPVQYPFYFTADDAGSAKVRTSFIKADDAFQAAVQLYHDNFNENLDKELHHWGDEESPPDTHDIFPDTCEWHDDETLADVVYYWLTRPTYQLTVEAYNQYMQSGYGISVYIDGEEVGTTPNSFEVTHGYHTVEVPNWVGGSEFDNYLWQSGVKYDNPLEIWITSNDDLYAWYWTYY
jgi:pimeloyl-ACP methyl ester carboxylesterase